MTGVDRLGLITRYECPTEGCPCHTPIFGQRHADDCPGPTRVRVDYVPVSQLEGAVDEAERLREAMTDAMLRLGKGPESHGNEVYLVLEAALRDNPGGQ
jgi:hypothetical protein